MIKSWIEAMRLRTLPVSLAGVIAAAALCVGEGCFRLLPILLCFVFAVLAQIASNFANEYYDYRDGLDRPGREGPRRGVTEGDITPVAMRNATFGVLGLACCVGLAIAWIGGWWLIGAGIVIALAVLAYSTGPYPLSRHGLGELAVVFFFGIIPVCLTVYVSGGTVNCSVVETSIAIGLMGANVLIVNNYRDCPDDAQVGKRTLAVVWGRKAVGIIYLLDGFLAVGLMAAMWIECGWWIIAPVVYLVAHVAIWRALITREGRAINPLLGGTAVLMFVYSVVFLLAEVLK